MSCKFKISILIVFSSLHLAKAQSQDKNESIITGSLQSMFTVYNFSSNDSLFKARQNPFGYNLSGNISIAINKKFNIPISLSYMNNQINASYPIPNFKFKDRLIHPSSILSFSPTFSWGTIYLGGHVPKVSKLLAGEVQIFGGGFDINPGVFRLAASYGIAELPLIPDSAKNILGTYKRYYGTLKIGIGKKDKSGGYLNLVRFRDDENSIHSISKTPRPKEGIGVSSDFDLKLSKKIKFMVEVGGTLFTDDKLALPADTSELSRSIAFLIQTKKSSFSDVAGKSTFEFNFSKFGFSLNADYLGAGFKTPGFPNRPSDLIDLTTNSRLTLFNSKCNFISIVGLRKDNLSNTKNTTNNSLLLNGNLNIQFFKFFSLSTFYANFGIERREFNDSLILSTISESFVISPSFNFKTGKITHNFNAAYNINNAENLNLFTGIATINAVTSFSGMYSIKISNFGLTLNSFITENMQESVTIHSNSFNVIPSLSLLEKKLKISSGINYTWLSTPSLRNDLRKSFRIKINYDLGNGIVINVGGGLLNMKSKVQNRQRNFQETTSQVGLNYNFGKKKSSAKNKIEKNQPKKILDDVVNVDKNNQNGNVHSINERSNSKEQKLLPNKEKANRDQSLKDNKPKKEKVSNKNKENFDINTKHLPTKDFEKGNAVVNLDATDSLMRKKVDLNTKPSKNDSVQKQVERKIIEISILPTIKNQNVITQYNKIVELDLSKLISFPSGMPSTVDSTLEVDEKTNNSLESQDKVGKIAAHDNLVTKEKIVNQKTDPTENKVINSVKTDEENVEFFIQLSANKSKVIVNKVYPRYITIITEKQEDGFFKYMLPAGKSIEEARDKLNKYKATGLKDGFIVKYRNNIRININD